MKTKLVLALAILGTALLSACESEHYHHRGDYGRPAPGYEYGSGHYEHHDRDWDGDWDRR
jgi:hypothetical protein